MKKVLFAFIGFLAITASAALVLPVRDWLEPVFAFAELKVGGYESVLTRSRGRGVWLNRNDFGAYSRQRREAQKHGIPLLTSDSLLESEIEQERLVAMPIRGQGFRVKTENFSHSTPHFTPTTLEKFQQFATEYHRNMQDRGYQDVRLVVCSGTRTTENQRKIAKVNSGATSGISAHSYGAALDLHAVEFRGKQGSQARSEALQTLKSTLQASEDFYWVLERSNLHLTAKSTP